MEGGRGDTIATNVQIHRPKANEQTTTPAPKKKRGKINNIYRLYLLATAYLY